MLFLLSSLLQLFDSKLCAHVPLIKMELKECTGQNNWSVIALALSEKKLLQVISGLATDGPGTNPSYPACVPILGPP